MKFGSPQWLWLLWFLPIVLGLMLYENQQRLKKFEHFAEQSLWLSIAPEFDVRARIRKGVTLLCALFFLILALARPQFGSHEETVEVTGFDIVFALDVSNSMNVEDVMPSRLQKAKHLIRSILDRLGGDRVGLVAFAGSSFVVSPLTADLEYVLDTLEVLSTNSVSNQGTNVGLGLQTAQQLLEGGAEIADPVGHEAGAEVPSKAVILISDGEDQEKQAEEMAVKIRESGSHFYALGLGTEKGGPIPLKDPQGNIQGYKRDSAGQPVISTYRSDFLAGIAKKSGGKYWTVTPDESVVDEILSALGALHRGKYQERRYIVYQERFQIPLVLAVFLMLLEMAWPSRKKIESMIASLLVLFFFSSESSAAVSLDAYLENKKGLQAFQEGKFEEARQSFGAAQARSPSQPELEFNQGVVHLQASDPTRAANAFTQSAQAAQADQNLPLLGKSLYNLGHALSKSGDVKGAVQAYVQAARVADEMKDEKLGNAARKNLQLLANQQDQKSANKDKPDQKNQQDQKDQQTGDQKKPDEQKAKDQSAQEKSAEKSEQKNTQEVPKEQRKQKFDSQKLSPEDAERVMSELTAREKALQEKLQNKHGKQKSNAKDW